MVTFCYVISTIFYEMNFELRLNTFIKFVYLFIVFSSKTLTGPIWPVTSDHPHSFPRKKNPELKMEYNGGIPYIYFQPSNESKLKIPLKYHWEKARNGLKEMNRVCAIICKKYKPLRMVANVTYALKCKLFDARIGHFISHRWKSTNRPTRYGMKWKQRKLKSINVWVTVDLLFNRWIRQGNVGNEHI